MMINLTTFQRTVVGLIVIHPIFVAQPLASNTSLAKYNKWKESIKVPRDPIKVFSFFYDNPDWPLFDKCVVEAEKNISQSLQPRLVIKWFRRYPPKTGQGLLKYCKCLLKCDPEIARKYIRQTWILQNLSAECAKDFRKEFASILAPLDDAYRAKRLTKQKKITQLKTLTTIVMPYISNYIRNFLDMAFRLKAEGYSKEDLEDARTRLSIVQSLSRQKKNREAANVLSLSNNDEEVYETDFFNQRRDVAYAALKDGNPAIAYKIISMCKIQGNSERIARNEWLLGYIAYRFLNKYLEAIRHFELAYRKSKKGIRLSKNAFWLAEVYRSKNDIILAIDWYKKSARYFNTFYGYIARYKLLNIQGRDFLTGNDSYNGGATKFELKIRFNNRELVQVLSSMSAQQKKADIRYIAHIYRKLIDDIEDPNEELMLFDLASSDEELDLLASEETSKQHYFDDPKMYKTLNDNDKQYIKKINADSCFVSLTHSIIRQESRFNQDAQSHVGAVGLMQVMPTTAAYELKRMSVHVDKKLSLFNRKKNILIGSWILNRLLKKYKGDIIYVIAAYNCGEGNLSKFQKSIKKIQPLPAVDLIEFIPFKETRTYVKHVVRNLFAYSKIFDANSCYNCPIIADFK
jgi:soluble lytic murein transglycosylase